MRFPAENRRTRHAGSGLNLRRRWPAHHPIDLGRSVSLLNIGCCCRRFTADWKAVSLSNTPELDRMDFGVLDPDPVQEFADRGWYLGRDKPHEHEILASAL